ncbi:MAG: phage replisome organizer N-terminal domain-containing protein [Clostridia bacterium]|nr:phage replisome organizer N-terminal domain-containing protein [Clostridia bacterium]
MADIKWIKLTTDMFDNRKIKHLRRLPEGNNIVLIWVMLLTMAGRCNSNGLIFLTENIPYTPKMLADELDFEENTVQLALRALEQLNMIVTNNGFFSIAGWEEYQNIEGMDKIREQNRLRKQRQREKQMLLEDKSRDSHVTVTGSHATDIEEDIEKEKEKRRIDYLHIKDMYNDICISFPRLTVLSDKRKQAIKARLNTYTVEQFKEMFEKAEASSFLKGSNNRNWQANFDWLIKDSNFAKVLDGNFDDKAKESILSGTKSYDTKSFFEAAVARAWEEKEEPKTAGEDPLVRERMEALKAQIQGE